MEQDKEIWKDIPKFEGYYQVSNLGRVKSLKRKIIHNTGIIQYISERILKSYKSNTGYHEIYPCKNNKYTRYKIARLVLTVFDRPPKIGEEACHYPDKNKDNNKINNLRWASHKENHNHRKEQGTFICGSKNYNSKINEDQAKEILRLSKTETPNHLIKKFKTTKGVIQGIIYRKTWKHLDNE